MKLVVTVLSVALSTALQTFEIPDWENSVHFELVSSQEPVRPGDAFEVALVAEIVEGYHLYGPEEPKPTRTAVTVSGSDLRAGEPSYPPVVRRDLSGLGTYDLYEGRIAIRVPVTLSKQAGSGPHTASMLVEYQVCTDYACSAPTSQELTVELSGAEPGAPVEKRHTDIFSSKK